MGHGLGLGQIQFPPSHTPYTPRERRGRARDTAAPLRLKPSRAPQSVPAARSGPQPPGDGTLSILPDDIAPAGVGFLLRSDSRRTGGSFAASLTSHAVGVGITAFLLSIAPERVYEVIQPEGQNYEGIVWLPEEGPGGGGGGGGNESLELPPQLEVEGPEEEALSLPVEDPPELIEPDPEPEEQPLQTLELSIPAVPVATAPETRAGLLEGLRESLSASQGSGTDGGAGTGEGGGVGPGQGDGLGPGQGGGTGGGIYRPGSGVTTPRVLHEERPEYTAEAMRARIQGTVWLEVVVLPDGTVGDVKVTKSLDRVFGLDEQAIAAARKWRFAPGMRFGEAVAVLVGLELFFNLR